MSYEKVTTEALSKLALIADPIMKHYKEDLTVHDRKTLEDCVYGDLFVWTAVPTGTHLIRVRSAQFDVATALDLHEAIEWGYKPHLKSWWMIRPTIEGCFEIGEIAVDDVRRFIAENQIQGRAVREQHEARRARRRERLSLNFGG